MMRGVLASRPSRGRGSGVFKPEIMAEKLLQSEHLVVKSVHRSITPESGYTSGRDCDVEGAAVGTWQKSLVCSSRDMIQRGNDDPALSRGSVGDQVKHETLKQATKPRRNSGSFVAISADIAAERNSTGYNCISGDHAASHEQIYDKMWKPAAVKYHSQTVAQMFAAAKQQTSRTVETSSHQAPRHRETSSHQAPRHTETSSHQAPRHRETSSHQAPRHRETRNSQMDDFPALHSFHMEARKQVDTAAARNNQVLQSGDGSREHTTTTLADYLPHQQRTKERKVKRSPPGLKKSFSSLFTHDDMTGGKKPAASRISYNTMMTNMQRALETTAVKESTWSGIIKQTDAHMKNLSEGNFESTESQITTESEQDNLMEEELNVLCASTPKARHCTRKDEAIFMQEEIHPDDFSTCILSAGSVCSFLPPFIVVTLRSGDSAMFEAAERIHHNIRLDTPVRCAIRRSPFDHFKWIVDHMYVNEVVMYSKHS